MAMLYGASSRADAGSHFRSVIGDVAVTADGHVAFMVGHLRSSLSGGDWEQTERVVLTADEWRYLVDHVAELDRGRHAEAG